MKLEILSIGTELLLGQTLNTNSAWLSLELAKIGVDVFFHTTVGDNPARIKEALSLACARSNEVILTGGLGPTEDDVTCRSVAEFAEKKLIFHSSILKKIRGHFLRRRIPMPKLNERQAYLPEGADEVSNPVGTAPGFILEISRKNGDGSDFPPFFLIALPGVPREMKPMFEQSIRPFLLNQMPQKEVLIIRTLRTTGLAESTIAQQIKRWLKLKPPLTVGIYAKLREVDVRIMAKAKNPSRALKMIHRVENQIKPKLKGVLFGADEQTLEETVVRTLIAKRKTLAVAESCTGGLLANRLTNVSGSSKTLQLGWVLYSNREKAKILNIPEDILKKQGAVSQPVAILMAQRVRELSQTNYGIGITGIAGPSGGTKEKPVGLVYIALANPTKTQCQKNHFSGNREEIKWQATQAALDMIRRYFVPS